MGLTVLPGQRPDGGGGTLQPAPFSALGLWCGPARAPPSGAAATTSHGRKARAGMAGSTWLARLDRPLCCWHTWDGHTATGASGAGPGPASAEISISWPGGLPSSCCDLVGSPQRKMAECLGWRPGGTTKGAWVIHLPCQTALPPHRRPLSSTAAPRTGTGSFCSPVTPRHHL